MTIQIYSTLSRSKVPLEPVEPGVVKMYVCGVTVYDQAHIGHAMSALVFDVVRRYLEFRGYAVQHVVNFTDVDDKIINRANTLGRDPRELAESYIAEFMDDLKALNVQPAHAYPRATETMGEILRFIHDLIARGYAYEAGGDVYFRVQADPDYGKLSGRRLEDMLVGTRFEVNERKESPADFALWKAAKPGEPAWDSPWGQGRPGWHIECSAMNLKHLGERIDIHGGGTDLIFPHHENEIAQTESLTNQTFARIWMHNGMLQIKTKQPDGSTKIEKMSKSLGNVVTIRDFLGEHKDADILRLIVLSSSYRSPLLYGAEIVDDQKAKLDRLRNALEEAYGQQTDGPDVERLAHVVKASRKLFAEEMDNDFNTSGALAVLFDLVKAINTARSAGVSHIQLSAAQDELCELASVLGLQIKRAKIIQQNADPFVKMLLALHNELKPQLDEIKQLQFQDLITSQTSQPDIGVGMDYLIILRKELRQAKQYALADTIRKRLAEKGYILKDTPNGTIWEEPSSQYI